MKKMNLIKKIKYIVLHPIAFAIFPGLSLYSINIAELTLYQLSEPLIISVAFSIILWAIINLILEDRRFSGLITSMLILLFFSYKPIIKIFNYEIISSYLIQLLSQLDNSLLKTHILKICSSINISLTIYLLLGITFILYIHPRIKLNKISNRNGLYKITILLNIVSMILLIVPFFKIVTIESNRLKKAISLSSLPLKKDALIEKTPDIYYLVIDSYVSNQSFNDYYNFDNSDFTKFLTDKGFYIAEKSKSNYPYTLTSLTSSLNMTYLDEAIKQIKKNKATDWTPVTNILETNQIVLYLKSKGYKYFNFGAPWYTNKNKNADFNYFYQTDGLNLSPLSHLLIDQTIFDPILPKMDCSGQNSFICLGTLNDRRIFYNFLTNEIRELSRIIKQPGPKFVFLHSLMTHTPYVFTDTGDYVPEVVEKSQNWRKNYISNVIFTNSILKDLIGHILESSKVPPVIILQSDEGTYPDRFRDDGEGEWSNASIDEIKEKTGILNAYYLPDIKSNTLYPSITPANSFRIVLNSIFGENLPLLSDLSFIQRKRMQLWEFVEVTDIIK